MRTITARMFWVLLILLFSVPIYLRDAIRWLVRRRQVLREQRQGFEVVPLVDSAEKISTQ